MTHAEALALARVIASFTKLHSPDFKVARARAGRPLKDFHKWADGKKLVSCDRIVRDDGEGLFLVLIDWHERGDFYCVLFPLDRSNPHAEVWQMEIDGAVETLQWTYRPVKRDGRNPERLAYFKKHVGATSVGVAVPNQATEVPRFFRDLFALVDNRERADRLDSVEPETRWEFPEGAIVEGLHRARERSSALVAIAKQRALEKLGKLACSVCAFDFKATYGVIGDGYIEAHHVVPLSELTGATVTKIEDLVLVCANCHRMLHRKRPWMHVTALTSILDGAG